MRFPTLRDSSSPSPFFSLLISLASHFASVFFFFFFFTKIPRQPRDERYVFPELNDPERVKLVGELAKQTSLTKVPRRIFWMIWFADMKVLQKLAEDPGSAKRILSAMREYNMPDICECLEGVFFFMLY